jgi:hypothetical protein
MTRVRGRNQKFLNTIVNVYVDREKNVGVFETGSKTNSEGF